MGKNPLLTNKSLKPGAREERACTGDPGLFQNFFEVGETKDGGPGRDRANSDDSLDHRTGI